jgi:hypothetical protein
MTHRKHFRLLIHTLFPFLFLPLAMWAQEDAPPVATDLPPVAFATDGKVINVFRAELTASTTFDDNAFGSRDDPVSDVGFYFNPVLGFQQSRKHVQFNLTYAPSVGISQRLSDQYTQMGGAEVLYTPTARLSFHARQDYAVTTNPFQDVLHNGFLPTRGPTNRPNNPALLPHLRQRTMMSNAGMGYRLTRHTSLGLRGYFYDFKSNNGSDSQGSTLISTRTTSGSFYLSHQLSARQTIGFQATLLDLFFEQTNSRTRAYNFNFFDDIVLTRRSTLSFYVGPEYSRTHDQVFVNVLFFIVRIPIFKTSWSPAGGAVYNWTGVRHAIQAGYTHGVSDGGGLLGAVRTDSGFLEIRRKLGAHLEADLGGHVEDSHALGLGSSTKFYYRQVSGTFGLSRQINDRASLRLSYSRLSQTGTSLYQQLGSHDRVQLSFSYQFVKPLGR